MKLAGAMTAQASRSGSNSTCPSMPCRTWRVLKPVQITSAKDSEKKLKKFARRGGARGRGGKGGGEKGVAGAEAGADDAEFLVALPFEPVQAGARVNDGLARGVHRPSDIGGDGVVGALQLRRHPKVVVREAEAQRRKAQKIQQSAKSHMLVALRIPVRQHKD